MPRYGVRQITDVVFKNITTGKPVLYLESLNVATNEITADTAYARGGAGNPKRIAWNSNKEVKYSMEDALISPEALSQLAGNDIATGVVQIHKKEVLTAVSDTGIKVTLAETPSTGASIFVFKTTDGTSIDTEIVVTTGYTIADKVITIVSGAVAGDKIIVDYYYDSQATAKRIKITSDKFPGCYKLEASTLWRDEATGLDVPAMYTMPKVKLEPGFTIENRAEGDPSVFNFNVEAFPNSDKEIEIIDIIV